MEFVHMTGLFDSSGLLERFDGDVSLIAEVATRFLTQIPQELAMLREDIRGERLESAKILAHKLAGALANLGDLVGTRSLRALESAIIHGDERTRIEALSERADQDVKRFSILFGKWLDQQENN